ncbi:MAG TPA: tripartite tricarboxylate transporter substrate binding protein [Burkholderiales bacterium]|nr:tripartite tricarboxylate transporter substrate binding protein [Burkholderiales bacterium]
MPFAPGGTNDIVARLAGAKLSAMWNQSVVVDNRAGASGMIGTDVAAKARPDGYTLLMTNINFATNASMMAKLPYDTVKDFEPVSLIATSPTVLVTHPSLPLKSVQDVIAYAKANPGKLTYSTSGAGSTTHIAMELLVYMTGIQMVPVHYKGGGAALPDLLAGRVSPAFATILSVAPHLEAGRLRGIAVSSSKRSAALPALPTVAEAGVPGYEFIGWWGVAVAAGTPQAIVKKINADLNKVMTDPDVKNRLAKEGAEAAHTTPAEYRTFIRAEVAKWNKVIKAANLAPPEVAR